ncbi:PEP-utilizing enzyme [Kitasatospora purpeofusca]|uniref:PEP/pyruvate-binding domain-containing protein n=1 Tax=Kitasatospora purpeofusca TaxID=67352 RepID=UPI002E13B75A|nr:PEP/pyruvate-binding domain-containing protein [Kitasatospora purpeofusca]WSR29680.1 PEP-utilizing enzyme [Kitasatospora purpeofusca]WSR37906.1 PEP-utilizing enzyme [Kitasatospora purpeofusca]
MRRVLRFAELGRSDVSLVGGKNASLGELRTRLGAAGVRVPDGFATTADAYREFLDTDGLRELVRQQLDRLHGGARLSETGTTIHAAVLAAALPPALERELTDAYHRLAGSVGRTDPDVAVRSSATWDLGETVVGGQVDPDEYVVFKPALGDPRLTPVLRAAVGAKRRKAVYSPTGLTEVVDTTPEERAARVLDPGEICALARWAVAVEQHYGCPMDIEWAKDGRTGELYLVQARPETVQSRRRTAVLRSYRLTGRGERLVDGVAVGEAVGAGPVCALASPVELDRFPAGAVLVTKITDPDWEPLMMRASAIVTDHGGRTSHAAIVSRELGVPAVVGTGPATDLLADRQEVTVSCAEGAEGHVYSGQVPYETTDTDLSDLPKTRTRVMLNLADPDAAFRWWQLPADGVGLARTEFVVAHQVRVHPMALVHPERLSADERRQVDALTEGYADRTDCFVDRLASGVARLAASRWPDPVIVRTSDFKTNEYARLVGGRPFEPVEANPMIGWRGASRYYDERYREGFALECRALLKVRDELGLTNVVAMIPFCRTRRRVTGCSPRWQPTACPAGTTSCGST